jgi:YD repeat-containing protein
VVLGLVIICVFLWRWKPAPHPVKVELLPFSPLAPAWDGSYPYLTISEIKGKPGRFETSISLVKPTIHHDSALNEFQVDLHSGMFLLRQTDLFVADSVPLNLMRTYRVWEWQSRAFGSGTNHPYDIAPTGTHNPYTYMDMNLEDGRPIRMRRVSKGGGYADAVFRHEATSSEFYGALVKWNGNGWTMDLADGSQFLFPDSYMATRYAQGAPYEIRDGAGHVVRLERDQRRNLRHLISPSGHTISFEYDKDDRIISATDDSGNFRKYAYDSSGHLQSVSDGSHTLYQFEYSPLMHARGYDPYLMTAIRNGRGDLLLQNIYEHSDGGRVSQQRLKNGEVYRYEYLWGKNNEAVETIVNGPFGTKRFFFQNGILAMQK